LVLQITGHHFSLVQPLSIDAATKLLGVVFFFIPGQVGASEGVYVVVFQALGLSASAGFTLALARRLRSMMVAGIGLVFLFFDRGPVLP
jgi:hypothetical protein